MRFEFFERGGGAGIIARMEGGGLTKQLVAPSWLGHESGPPPNPCPADLDDSGDVAIGDLLVVLASWGPCSGACAADFKRERHG